MRKEKIKVMYLVSTLRRTGPTNQLLGIVSNLDSRFDSIVLTISPEPKKSMKSVFLEKQIKVDSMNLSRVSTEIVGTYKLKKMIAHYKPDIIHSSGIRADNMLEKIKFPERLMTVRNYVYEDYSSKFPLIDKYLSKKHLKIMKNNPNVIFCSYSLNKIYEENHNVRGETIQNGVDLKKFSSIFPEEKMYLKKKMGLIDKKVYISVGSLIERKNPMTVIKAFNQFAKDKENVFLLMLGDGNLREKAESISEGKIKFLGNVEKVEKYLSISDVFISASFSEGLPNTVLEAGAVGTQMILSSIPQHREIFTENDPSVLFFDPHSTIDLANKLEFNYLLKTEENKFILNQIRNNFSTVSMSKKYQKKYLDILKK